VGEKERCEKKTDQLLILIFWEQKSWEWKKEEEVEEKKKERSRREAAN